MHWLCESTISSVLVPTSCPQVHRLFSRTVDGLNIKSDCKVRNSIERFALKCALDASYSSLNRSSHNFVLRFNLIVTRAHDIMNKKENHSVAAVSFDDNTSLKGVLLKRIDFVGLVEDALAHPNRTYYYR